MIIMYGFGTYILTLIVDLYNCMVLSQLIVMAGKANK